MLTGSLYFRAIRERLEIGLFASECYDQLSGHRSLGKSTLPYLSANARSSLRARCRAVGEDRQQARCAEPISRKGCRRHEVCSGSIPGSTPCHGSRLPRLMTFIFQTNLVRLVTSEVLCGISSTFLPIPVTLKDRALGSWDLDTSTGPPIPTVRSSWQSKEPLNGQSNVLFPSRPANSCSTPLQQ